jgi:hypothetical protein
VPVLVAGLVVGAFGGTTYALRAACGITRADAGALAVRSAIPATTTLTTATADGVVVDDLAGDRLCDVGPAAWREAAVDPDDRTLTVVRLGSSCERLAAIDVRLDPDAVTVTLSSGDPTELALGLFPRGTCDADDATDDRRFIAAVVELPEPLAGRTVVDGARGDDTVR